MLTVKVPNKVMSGYVDECIVTLIRNCSVLKKLSTVPSPGADGVEVSYFSTLFQWDYVNLLILKISL